MDNRGHQMRGPIDEPQPLTHVGDCLHSSFTADNHESLGDGIVRSLLHLSREPKTASMRAKLGSAQPNDSQ